MHERETSLGSTPGRHSVTSSPPSASLSLNRKRGRKPDKSAICHLITVEADSGKPETESGGSSIKIPVPKTETQIRETGFSLPKLSEVTITPAAPKTGQPRSARSARSPSPEIVEICSEKSSPGPCSVTLTRTSGPLVLSQAPPPGKNLEL